VIVTSEELLAARLAEALRGFDEHDIAGALVVLIPVVQELLADEYDGGYLDGAEETKRSR
jgi:hypothetical protein